MSEATPWARDSRQGIREFVLGTGGAELQGFAARRANSQVRLAGVHGVLELVLHPSNYEWRFISESGPCSTRAVRSPATEAVKSAGELPIGR